jgi:two-component system, NtrC family, response regulator
VGVFEGMIEQLDDILLSGNCEDAEQLLNTQSEHKLSSARRRILDRKWIRLLFIKGDVEGALRRIKSYLRRYKPEQGSDDWMEAHCMESFLNISSGRLKAAEKTIKLLKEAVETHQSGKHCIKLNIGCLMRDSGNWDKAADILEEVYQAAGPHSEMSNHAALVISEMFTDLNRSDTKVWIDRVLESSTRWGEWEYLKLGEIMRTVDQFRQSVSSSAINDLYRHLGEADQLGRVPPRLRIRLALAEAMILVGDIGSAKDYILEAKEIIDCCDDNISRYYQPLSEILWFQSILETANQSERQEALDRLEILLAVIAKYSKPPGAAPFWYLIGEFHASLGQADGAIRAYRKAQQESAVAGSSRMECRALFGLAAFEWAQLPEPHTIQSAEKNRILAITATALEKAILSNSKDMEWQIHQLRGKMFIASGEQYPSDNEMSISARIVQEIMESIRDPHLRKLYRECPKRQDAIESLRPFLEKIGLDTKSEPEVASRTPVKQVESETQEIQALQMMLDALIDLYAASSIQELLTRCLRHILVILNADRVQIRMDARFGLNQSKYTGVKSQQTQSDQFTIPGKWIRSVKNMDRSMIYTRDPDEEDANKRSVICAPFSYKKIPYGIIYADRIQGTRVFDKSDIELLDTMIQAASATLSTLMMRNRLNDLTDQFRKEIVPQFPHIIGNSDLMKEVFVLIEKVASADIPVLIMGETGTGKDIVAQTIHSISHRKEFPYVYLDCSAIPASLLESELFGIEKGTATGVEPRIGLLEYANGGTVLLDEVADIPLSVQAKLLRVLQEREFEPVGSDRIVTVDIRILSTTSRDILSLIENQQVREDFYYRINGISIEIPPLRDRIGDVILLARTFLQRYNAEFKKRISGFTPKAMDAMDAYRWSGNVRELDHVIRKAVLFSTGKKITHGELGIPPAGKRAFRLKEARDEFERQVVHEIHESTGGDLQKTSDILQVSLKRLERLLKK